MSSLKCVASPRISCSARTPTRTDGSARRRTTAPASHPPDDRDGRLRTGWARWLTVHSAVPDIDARQASRAHLGRASADRLAEIDAISTSLADAIVRYREKSALESVGHLLDVTWVADEESNQGQGEGGEEGRGGEGSKGDGERNDRGQPSGQQGGGEKLISKSLFQDIVDHVTTHTGLTISGLVNINGAELNTLMCLGLDETLAQSIIDHRNLYGEFANLGGLLDVPGMDIDRFKPLSRAVCARPATFRIYAEGSVPSTGARRGVEIVVQFGRFGFDTLAYRDDF